MRGRDEHRRRARERGLIMRKVAAVGKTRGRVESRECGTYRKVLGRDEG